MICIDSQGHRFTKRLYAIILGHEHRLSFTDRRDAIFTKDMLIDPPPEGKPDTPQKVEPGMFDRAIPDMLDPL